MDTSVGAERPEVGKGEASPFYPAPQLSREGKLGRVRQGDPRLPLQMRRGYGARHVWIPPIGCVEARSAYNFRSSGFLLHSRE